MRPGSGTAISSEVEMSKSGPWRVFVSWQSPWYDHEDRGFYLRLFNVGFGNFEEGYVISFEVLNLTISIQTCGWLKKS